MNPLFYIAYFSAFSPLLALGLSFRLRSRSRDIRLIQVLLAMAFIIDVVCIRLAMKGINTYPLGNLFSLVQSVLFLLIYWDALKIKLSIVWILTPFTILFLLNYFYLQGPFILNSLSHTITAVIFIFLALLYFRLLLIELPVIEVYRLPMLWINLAVLIYFSGNLFLFILFNYFSKGADGNQFAAWLIHNVLNISKNILLLIAIWQSLRKTSLSSS